MMMNDQNEFSVFDMPPTKECAGFSTVGHLQFEKDLQKSAPSHRRRNSDTEMELTRTMRDDHGQIVVESSALQALPLDLKALMSRCMDDEELVEEVMSSFCEQCELRVSSLSDSMETGNYEQCNFDLDFISGAAKNVEAVALDESVSKLHSFVRPCSEPGNTSPLNGRAKVRRNSSNDSLDDISARRSSMQTGNGDSFGRVSSTPHAQALLSRVRIEFDMARMFWLNVHEDKGNAVHEDQGNAQNQSMRTNSFLQRSKRLNSFIRRMTGKRPDESNLDWSSECCSPSGDRATTPDQFERSESNESSTDESQKVEDALQGLSSDFSSLEIADWSLPETMGSFFESATQQMKDIRKNFSKGKRGRVQVLVEQIQKFSKKAGLRGLCTKAEAIVSKDCDDLRYADVEKLEQQLDSSKAIWESCKLKI
mmetsp:Transcript_1273/g.2501  ORF Transcript_1273/g.2501 Transcript_1273/m.2501 type:complete len:424 (+) Transcript_1273:88-1359(+)